MSGLSAVLITRNAETHLDNVLRPLDCCDEILVLDSGSTDQTLSIAHEYGARIAEHPFDDFGRQKNRAIDLAEHDWILNLDADEILDGAAQLSLRDIDFARADDRTCWRILRRPFIGTSEVRHGHWAQDRLIRLFNRRQHHFSEHPIHPTVAPRGPVHELSGSMLHFCYRDLIAVFETDYHRRKAALYRAQGRRASAPALFGRGCWAFVYSYVIRKGILDGRLGIVTAMAGALNAVLGLAQASEPEE